jgi:decaprenylphospho-beta-D-erythro-pentofuranosid-2-ulose 2-reductase
MNNRKTTVIVGATSAIAEHCARLWVAQAPFDLILLGRDAEKMGVIAADLRVRSPESRVTVQLADFVDPVKIQQQVDSLFAAGAVDIALIAHGNLPDQQACQTDIALVSSSLFVNATSPLLYAEAFAANMQKMGAGVIAIIGSVAGDRGRRSNYVYGAAKGAVTRYAQGLQHRFAGTGVDVVLIKPGPTDTPMTAHLKTNGPRMAPVEQVAACIVKGIEQKKSVVYAPGKWALIMMIIRHLPQFVFNKLNI